MCKIARIYCSADDDGGISFTDCKSTVGDLKLCFIQSAYKCKKDSFWESMTSKLEITSVS